jgi:hypothetical protein
MPYFGSVTCNLYGNKKKNGLFAEFNYGGAHAWLAPSITSNDFQQSVKAWNFFLVSVGYAHQYEKLRLAVQTGFHALQTKRSYQYGDGYFYPTASGNIYIPPRQTFIEYEMTRFFVGISFGI